MEGLLRRRLQEYGDPRRYAWSRVPLSLWVDFDYPGEDIGCWNKRHDSDQPALVRPYMSPGTT
ncbi:hypothetical protein CDO52_23350 [Nocardiopsis gilva YIM 90087]|uniref:Uncharacterized protein n=1 Tax=Nocardiopsis gilva YIM 90087 TaxID=1235441 RepID=A0A223SB61_9ACTN|nr:hypothetical protein CDO52_23350 [Nocardiopsis gilva YIM 90087]